MGAVVITMSISLDGYGAGDDQTEERPFGDIDETPLHAWMFETPEENAAERDAITAAGAFIMGRNMFGPVRGGWDREWNGWWGSNPPYHRPVFVLTHHERAPVAMEGGTTFHFVTDGIESALEQAQAAAGELPVHIAGGPGTANQFLAAGLVDELRLQIAPILLGHGRRLFEGVDEVELETLSVRAVALTTHVHYRVKK